MTFLSDESGAITVDWVVLTAAMAGLTIAASNTIGDGMDFIAARLDGELGNGSISAPPADIGLVSMDFAAGETGGWTAGSVMDRIDALGDILILAAGEQAELEIDFPSGRRSAVIQFDLIGGDSLDNEFATMQINGETIVMAQGMWGGTMNFEDLGVSGFTLETETLSDATNLGGSSNSGWKDSVTKVTITVDDPGDLMTFGLISGANQSIYDEFFGLDNFEVIAVY